MSAALRAELFKQRSTRTAAGLLVAALGLVVFVVLLHGLGVAAEHVDSSSKQLTLLFGWGEIVGALFAALLGAMSVTGEIRHGTIRPTFLVSPWRSRVIAAKVLASMLIGSGIGLVAGAVAAGVGTAALRTRGIDVQLEAGDYTLLVAGGAAAAALWAAIGVGVGAIVRNQMPALVGIVVWLLLVENVLVGDIAGAGDIGRLLPGAAGKAMTGQDPNTLLKPAVGLILLGFYAVAAAITGTLGILHRDVD
jgi:ABC-type transport system involved in multi-copper enzyme maturation permease subunit